VSCCQLRARATFSRGVDRAQVRDQASVREPLFKLPRRKTTLFSKICLHIELGTPVYEPRFAQGSRPPQVWPARRLPPNRNSRACGNNSSRKEIAHFSREFRFVAAHPTRLCSIRVASVRTTDLFAG
jgi:hypothetical protein